jgi:hypothetical protein
MLEGEMLDLALTMENMLTRGGVVHQAFNKKLLSCQKQLTELEAGIVEDEDLIRASRTEDLPKVQAVLVRQRNFYGHTARNAAILKTESELATVQHTIKISEENIILAKNRIEDLKVEMQAFKNSKKTLYGFFSTQKYCQYDFIITLDEKSHFTP